MKTRIKLKPCSFSKVRRMFFLMLHIPICSWLFPKRVFYSSVTLKTLASRHELSKIGPSYLFCGHLSFSVTFSKQWLTGNIHGKFQNNLSTTSYLRRMTWTLILFIATKTITATMGSHILYNITSWAIVFSRYFSAEKCHSTQISGIRSFYYKYALLKIETDWNKHRME